MNTSTVIFIPEWIVWLWVIWAHAVIINALIDAYRARLQRKLVKEQQRANDLLDKANQ